MIKISKTQRDYLVDKGVSCGHDGVSRTYGKHKTYYLCESEKNLKLLNEFNDSTTK